MFDFVTEFFSGELTISESSWHHRWYRYWQKKGGQIGPKYVENLCHYVRVLVFWAPRRWFFHAQTMQGLLRPWIVAILLTPFVFLGVAELLGLGGDGRIVFYALLEMDVIVLLVNLLIWDVRVNDAWYEKWAWEHSKGFLIPVGKITWVVTRFTALALWWVWTPGGNQLYKIKEAVRRWSLRHPNAVPLGIGMVVLAWLGLIVYQYPIQFIAIVTLIVIVGAVLIGGSAWYERWKTSSPEAAFPGSKFAGGAAGTVKVVGHFALAKKRRVCPFINFERESAA